MRRVLGGAIVCGAVVLAFSLAAVVDTTQAQTKAAAHGPNYAWKFHPKDRAIGTGGPAPKRDLTGTWAGPGSGMAVKRTNIENPIAPPLTALGEKLYAMNKPIGKFSPAGTNDPHDRYCDPYGFPEDMTNEIRGLQITTMPHKMIFMIQYMDMWREVWTDGRPLPTNIGGTNIGRTGKYVLQPRYNGYSVGHWEGDYNFVVETVGMDPATWATKSGYPHSADARVIERYTRIDHNDMKDEITLIDPKIYTKPFEIGTVYFRWVPNQQLDEWLCIPSQVIEYMRLMGNPAGSYPNAAGQQRR
jgi:hypothetical protein